MMRIKKMIKMPLVLVGVVCITLNSFAAIVSDNDGAAFVTKFEFENLKSNFQTEVNNYNSSLDRKIDGKITTYLEALKIPQPVTNLVNKYEDLVGSKMTWLYAIPGSGTKSRVAEVSLTSTGYLTRKSVSNFYYNAGGYSWKDSQLNYYPLATLMFGSGHAFQTSGGYGNWNYGSASPGVQHTSAAYTLVPSTFNRISGNVSQATYATYNTQASEQNVVSNGTGSGWLTQKMNGIDVLKYYCPSLYPVINLEYYVHWYKCFEASSFTYYLDSSGFTFSDVLLTNLDTLVLELGKTKSLGTKYGSGSTSSGKYISGSANLIKTTNGVNYLNSVWGISNTTTVYTNDENYVGKSASSVTSTSWPSTLTWTNQYYTVSGLQRFQSTFPSTTTNYKGIVFDGDTKTIGDFGNTTLTSIAGEKVMNGNGVPCMLTQDNEYDASVTFKLTTTSGTATCLVMFSDQAFNNGSIRTGASQLASTTVTTGTSKTLNFEIPKKGNTYMFIKNQTNTNPITIDSFICK